jgi:type IV secretory pathway VirB2 component (pilin)
VKTSQKTLRLASVAVPVLFLSAANAAMATVTAAPGGGGTSTLPWEGILSTLANALTGNTAKIICIIAIFVAGVALIFGEDLGQFAKRLLMIVIASAFLIGAGSFVTSFLGGAHI